jgi:hypothetical protein
VTLTIIFSVANPPLAKSANTFVGGDDDDDVKTYNRFFSVFCGHVGDHEELRHPTISSYIW